MHPLYEQGEELHQGMSDLALAIFAADDLTENVRLSLAGMAFDLSHDADEVLRAVGSHDPREEPHGSASTTPD